MHTTHLQLIGDVIVAVWEHNKKAHHVDSIFGVHKYRHLVEGVGRKPDKASLRRCVTENGDYRVVDNLDEYALPGFYQVLDTVGGS